MLVFVLQLVQPTGVASSRLNESHVWCNYPRTSRKYCTSSCKTASATRSCTVTRSALGTSTNLEITLTAPRRSRWQIAHQACGVFTFFFGAGSAWP